MEKAYEPRGIENRWYETWESRGWFKPEGTGTPYCILLPPPNVTGTLHMGHAFQQTLMDTLSRYHRMRGERVLWQGGTDHAGIATQKIVENQLAAAGKTRHDLGRQKFVERVWEWKEESGSTITRQMRRLGASVDWSRERFTMDPGLSAAVKRVFVQWYRDGLLYRGKRLVHWDPVLQTAVSDLEVDNEERDGSLWLIRYPAADGGEGLTVATTRPETMLGDVAVVVHPEDERYRKIVGKKLKLPLSDREIPVIADEYVDKEFGTGAVKITPAHDFNDQVLSKRHNLPVINIFTLDAKVNENAPAAYRGLDRFAARKKVIADLEAAGLLVETKKHKLMVPISQRSNAVIEPMLTDQWFLDLTSDKGRKAITEPALDAVRSGKIKFVPENWNTTYIQWLENIQDWCVSRQLWWGHQIPAWFDEAGNIFVGEDEADALKHAKTPPVGKLRQDEDVLDTWFSSALWPFSTLGWPGDTPERAKEWQDFNAFLPSSVLITGFDIIFFWVARMVMATQYFTKRVPFKEVYINAIVRDAEGQKMSKSKGNTIDPLDLIDGIELEPLVQKSVASLLLPKDKEKVEKRVRRDYPEGIPAVGADALRFTFAALATHSRTINFDLKRCEGYRNFCNKLWNATRFVLMNCEDFKPTTVRPPLKTPVEHWIVSKLYDLSDELDRHYRDYRFDLAAQALYEFTWNDFCDWFVELSKPALNGEDQTAADSTRHTLLYTLAALLRALHPIIPFITEELWQQVAPKLGVKGESVSRQTYPQSKDLIQPDRSRNAEVEWLCQAVLQIRSIRSQMGVAPSRAVPLLIELPAGHKIPLTGTEPYLKFLARLESIRILAPSEQPPPSAAAVLDQARLLIPMAGLIDMAAERERLAKEIARIEGEITRAGAKLDKPDFVQNAPAAVVDKERQRVKEFETTLQGLREQSTRLAAL
ncbi:MAG TPA: valine--tRNA ligase [Gammaproteobacteria bacterium]|jgi:valyl-tRNA synthetase|nr:valine--tRNA ligase [Gammaproteobacteria bacterium]